MEERELYNRYSKYLQERFGQKVYKLPIKLDLTCPNRDGSLAKHGCTFCGEEGGSFENLSNQLTVRQQLLENKDYIGKRYKAEKFIAYFQNFSNTYLPLKAFKNFVNQAIIEDVVGISISTRPDCISDSYLEFLQEIKEDKGLDITLEIGLQTVNYHSLEKINRGHSLAEFIDAQLRIKKYGLRSCAHMILNLPWDDFLDTIEGARILSSLQVDEVKLHSLYLMKGTEMTRQYEEGQIKLISKEDYMERVIGFLEYLDPDIVVQRLIGRAPEEDAVFVNWDQSWWKIRDEIEELMKKRETFQGRKFNYLNGKALRSFD